MYPHSVDPALEPPFLMCLITLTLIAEVPTAIAQDPKPCFGQANSGKHFPFAQVPKSYASTQSRDASLLARAQQLSSHLAEKETRWLLPASCHCPTQELAPCLGSSSKTPGDDEPWQRHP